jgi:hypothetical protein
LKDMLNIVAAEVQKPFLCTCYYKCTQQIYKTHFFCTQRYQHVGCTQVSVFSAAFRTQFSGNQYMRICEKKQEQKKLSL